MEIVLPCANDDFVQTEKRWFSRDELAKRIEDFEGGRWVELLEAAVAFILPPPREPEFHDPGPRAGWQHEAAVCGKETPGSHVVPKNGGN